MHVAAWMEGFPSWSETYVLWHLAELARDGHRLSLFPARLGTADPMPREVVELGLLALVRAPPELPRGRVARLADLGRASRRALARHPAATARLLAGLRPGPASAGWVQALRHLAHVEAPGRFDVHHAYFGPPGRRAELLRRAGGVRGPLVTSFLGFDLNVLGERLGGAYYRDLFRHAERLCVSTEFMRRKLLGLGAPPERVELLPLGLPLADFPFAPRRAPPQGPVRLLSAARLTEVKGLEWGLRGLALARSRRPGLAVRWDVLGDGPLGPSLRALVAELRLEPLVIFHGAQPMAVVREHLAQAHLCLFPGVRARDGAEEALGGAVLEAQASGLPVLTTDAGGIAEGMVPGESGVVVPQRDADALAQGLLQLLDRSNEWPAMGARGRAHVAERYDSRTLHPRWLALYRSLA